MSTERPQTGLRKGPDGKFTPWCRICPRRTWRLLNPDERASGWFDTADEAHEQARRHRRSGPHQDAVIRAASTEPSDEEIVLARIFGEKPHEPCVDCGFHHSRKLSCIKAAQIRDKEIR